MIDASANLRRPSDRRTDPPDASKARLAHQKHESSRTRVLLVAPIGDIGGAEQVFLRLAGHLPKFGVEPVVACMRPGPLAEAARALGVAAFAYRPHRYRQIGLVAKGAGWLVQLARSTNVDLLHASHTAHLYAGPACRWLGIPEVWHLHDYPHRRTNLERLLLMCRPSHTIFTTNKVRSGYPKLATAPHSVIPPTSVDAEMLAGPQSDVEVRGALGLPAGPLFLTVARLQTHKGHPYLIDAAKRVLAVHPQAQFVIVGKAADDAQAAYRDSLVRQASSLGIEKHVHFPGYVGNAELAVLYRCATALVHPAITEGYGLTLLEAMAGGLPVIAAAADGPAEIIADGRNGLLVPTADAEALAAAIMRLLNDPPLARRLADEGRRYASSNRVEHMVDRVAEVYRQVMAQRGGARGVVAT